MFSKGLYLSFIFSLFWSGCLQAKELDLSFSGFATLGLTHNSSDELQYHRDFTINSHEGTSLASSSIIGGQANLDFSGGWDAVVQVVYQDRVSNKLDDYFEWAFLRRRLGRNWAIRAGRLHADLYLLSEYKTVGYAYLWTHPPVEFYGPAVSVSQINGVDIEYSTNIGAGFLQTKLAYGSSEAKMQGFIDKFDMTFDDITVGNITYSQNDWKIRVSFAQVEIEKLSLGQPLISALRDVPRAFWPEVDNIINDINHEGHHIHYTGVGYQYDSDSWLIQAEYGSTISGWALLPSYTNGYISLGYKVGNATFYSTLSAVEPRDEVQPVPAPSIPIGAPPQLAAGLQALHTGVERTIQSSGLKQKTFSLGARWDFKSNMSFKLQIDRTLVYANSAALWHSPSLSASTQYVTLLSANVNVVF